MGMIVAEFFSLVGLDMVPPENMAELIPYLLTFTVSVCLVSGVFRVIGKIADILIGWRRW